MRTIILKLKEQRRSVKARLKFHPSDGCGSVRLPAPLALALGLPSENIPGVLLWRLPGSKEWEEIPLNHIDAHAVIGPGARLEDLLFYRFAGRALPGKKIDPPSNVPELPGLETGDPKDQDEEELTHSEYQGALDRFVLEWRLIARRIAASCRGDRNDWRTTVQETIREIADAAEADPTVWPSSKLAWVRECLESSWPG